MRKYITAMICMLALMVIASAAMAQSGKTVILVSDNEADSAVADAVQNIKNIDVITTPWNEFNESVVTQITALDPSTVFILGGPVAVSSDYEIALSSYTIIRVSGADRYATAAAALEHFRDDFKGKGVVVAYGYDSKGIKKALEKAKKLGWIVLFVEPDDVPDEVESAIDDSGAGEVEVEESPDMDSDEIEHQLNMTKAKVKFAKMNETEKADRASEQIEEAGEEIEEAEEKITKYNLSNTTANELLQQAKEHLTNADEAYANGSYGEAFGQAIAAEHLAKNAKKVAKHESKHDPKDALKQIEKARKKIGKAEDKIIKYNLSNTTANELLQQAKEHLENAEAEYNNGSYGSAFAQAKIAKRMAENAKEIAKHERKKRHVVLTLWQEKDGSDIDDDEEHDEEHEGESEEDHEEHVNATDTTDSTETAPEINQTATNASDSTEHSLPTNQTATNATGEDLGEHTNTTDEIPSTNQTATNTTEDDQTATNTTSE